MPARSKKQQQFMGIVRAVQKGEKKPSEVSPAARKAAKEMDPEDVKDFAKTKHKGLPAKKEAMNEKRIQLTPDQFADKIFKLKDRAKKVGGSAASELWRIFDNFEIDEPEDIAVMEVRKWNNFIHFLNKYLNKHKLTLEACKKKRKNENIRRVIKNLVREVLNEAKHNLKKGDKVKLRPDVLRRHAKSVPAHAGYTKEQFQWRKVLDDIGNEVGEIERIFPNSNHVNVQFKKHLIGIEASELIKQ